jgi:tRNA(Arg) A34 adenosine deaminase TadA
MTDRETLDFTDPMQRPRFTGLATFFRSPWREDFEADPPEIGVCGVPYDGGVTNRPGPRHGPREVRNLSSFTRRVNQATGINPFAAAKVADIGDAWIRKPYELEGAHAEIEAIRVAQLRLDTHDLANADPGELTLFTSCAPCVMCFGAIYWSGLARVVSAAPAQAAEAIGFDEGPVTEAMLDRARKEKGIAFETQAPTTRDPSEPLRVYEEQGHPLY